MFIFFFCLFVLLLHFSSIYINMVFITFFFFFSLFIYPKNIIYINNIYYLYYLLYIRLLHLNFIINLTFFCYTNLFKEKRKNQKQN